MDELRQRLLEQAFLYDSPHAYTAGVEAALRAVDRAELPRALPGRPEEPVQRATRNAS